MRDPYRVCISRVEDYEIVVDANSPEEACEMVEEMDPNDLESTGSELLSSDAYPVDPEE